VIGFLANWGWIIVGLAFVVSCVVWPAAVWRFKWQILLAIAIAAALMFYADAAQLRSAIGARDLADAQAAAQLSQDARAKETADARNLAAIGAAYEKGKEDGKAEFNAVRDDRDSGALVLREKFKCPAPGVLPGAATAAGIGDGGSQAVLSEQDEDFLIRLSAEADEVTRQLKACQAVVAAGQVEGKP
jgi:hypothetical protein